MRASKKRLAVTSAATVIALGGVAGSAYALGSLHTLDREAPGFFLQVESASIDKQDHAANACGQIGETGQLDDAVQAALRFAKAGGNTMVVVTADHAHTSQIVDGAPMVVAYGTAAMGGSQQHTGTQVRVAGYGPGAANVVGLIDQTDLFHIVGDSFKGQVHGRDKGRDRH